MKLYRLLVALIAILAVPAFAQDEPATTPVGSVKSAPAVETKPPKQEASAGLTEIGKEALGLGTKENPLNVSGTLRLEIADNGRAMRAFTSDANGRERRVYSGRSLSQDALLSNLRRRNAVSESRLREIQAANDKLAAYLNGNKTAGDPVLRDGLVRSARSAREALFGNPNAKNAVDHDGLVKTVKGHDVFFQRDPGMNNMTGPEKVDASVDEIGKINDWVYGKDRKSGANKNINTLAAGLNSLKNRLPNVWEAVDRLTWSAILSWIAIIVLGLLLLALWRRNAEEPEVVVEGNIPPAGTQPFQPYTPASQQPTTRPPHNGNGGGSDDGQAHTLPPVPPFEPRPDKVQVINLQKPLVEPEVTEMRMQEARERLASNVRLAESRRMTEPNVVILSQDAAPVAPAESQEPVEKEVDTEVVTTTESEEEPTAPPAADNTDAEPTQKPAAAATTAPATKPATSKRRTAK